ncbi:hypothetical protein EXIGLDRAFT_394122 [Exidia glandulosa HHB12029]|uniref:Uncharacterized protein n=1 Tax=Exidia glandulosa HHB12029 TaxID=1314781 RepID=A0A165BQN6_EXIGL|nr:hypothetical protein EXIGLDRAFT_394122 [Exidia glandulosa HHB12029]
MHCLFRHAEMTELASPRSNRSMSLASSGVSTQRALKLTHWGGCCPKTRSEPAHPVPNYVPPSQRRRRRRRINKTVPALRGAGAGRRLSTFSFAKQLASNQVFTRTRPRSHQQPSVTDLPRSLERQKHFGTERAHVRQRLSPRILLHSSRCWLGISDVTSRYDIGRLTTRRYRNMGEVVIASLWRHCSSNVECLARPTPPCGTDTRELQTRGPPRHRNGLLHTGRVACIIDVLPSGLARPADRQHTRATLSQRCHGPVSPSLCGSALSRAAQVNGQRLEEEALEWNESARPGSTAYKEKAQSGGRSFPSGLNCPGSFCVRPS